MSNHIQNFLPWCKDAKIIETHKDKDIIADLDINFKAIHKKYTSKIVIKSYFKK